MASLIRDRCTCSCRAASKISFKLLLTLFAQYWTDLQGDIIMGFWMYAALPHPVADPPTGSQPVPKPERGIYLHIVGLLCAKGCLIRLRIGGDIGRLVGGEQEDDSPPPSSSTNS
jgi:hypothetical protein